MKIYRSTDPRRQPMTNDNQNPSTRREKQKGSEPKNQLEPEKTKQKGR